MVYTRNPPVIESRSVPYYIFYNVGVLAPISAIRSQPSKRFLCCSFQCPARDAFPHLFKDGKNIIKYVALLIRTARRNTNTEANIAQRKAEHGRFWSIIRLNEREKRERYRTKCANRRGGAPIYIHGTSLLIKFKQDRRALIYDTR